MSAVRMALALAWTVVAIGAGGVQGQASLPAFQFDVGVTDNCTCLKVVITSLYRAGETLDNIKSYAGARTDQHEQAVECYYARPVQTHGHHPAANQLQELTTSDMYA